MGGMLETSNESIKRAKGCVYGAFIGDSLGSYREFEKKDDPESQDMDFCMKMPGGGPFKVGPGQITDDSELAMCIMWGIIKSNEGTQQNEIIIDSKKICEYYRDWILSEPYDIGVATQQSLGILENVDTCEPKKVRQAAKLHNDQSMSNGSLMRCTPLVVLTAGLSKQMETDRSLFQDLKNIIISDVSLTHSNLTVHRCVLTYTIAIHSLINSELTTTKSRAQEAIQKVQHYENDLSTIDNDNQDIPSWIEKAKQYAMESEEEQKNQGNEKNYYLHKNYDANTQIGFLKHAFFMSFYFLFKLSSQQDKSEDDEIFDDCLREVVSLGGDTDTNACIVGGMIGALVSEGNIQKAHKNTLLKFDCVQNFKNGNGQKRDSFLSTKQHLERNLNELIRIAKDGHQRKFILKEN